MKIYSAGDEKKEAALFAADLFEPIKSIIPLFFGAFAALFFGAFAALFFGAFAALFFGAFAALFFGAFAALFFGALLDEGDVVFPRGIRLLKEGMFCEIEFAAEAPAFVTLEKRSVAAFAAPVAAFATTFTA